MSRENVKIALIEAAYEALAEGGLDRFLEFWTEDLDHRAIEGALDDRGPLHGREAMRAYVQDWMDTFDGLEIRPIELIDGGGNTVAAVLRFGGRAKLSGLATDSTFGVVFWIRDGKIARGREYVRAAPRSVTSADCCFDEKRKSGAATGLRGRRKARADYGPRNGARIDVVGATSRR